MRGIIFDIKEFSIHDGPGMRVTVFLKGCPMRCLWCHNPEGLSPDPQLMCKESVCTHCGKCRVKCTHPECEPFGRCMHICPNGCISIAGERVDSDILAKKILSYRHFFDSDGGGVTFSGGEPMMQADFLCETADKLVGVHKAIQTNGYTDAHTYRLIINKFDYIMQDIKIANPQLHKQYTGVDNACILENIDYLKKSGRDFVFRVPLIPNITDTPENLKALSEIIGDYRVELLNYNVFASAKYEMVGLKYTLKELKSRTEDFCAYFRNAKME